MTLLCRRNWGVSIREEALKSWEHVVSDSIIDSSEFVNRSVYLMPFRTPYQDFPERGSWIFLWLQVESLGYTDDYLVILTQVLDSLHNRKAFSHSQHRNDTSMLVSVPRIIQRPQQLTNRATSWVIYLETLDNILRKGGHALDDLAYVFSLVRYGKRRLGSFCPAFSLQWEGVIPDRVIQADRDVVKRRADIMYDIARNQSKTLRFNRNRLFPKDIEALISFINTPFGLLPRLTKLTQCIVKKGQVVQCPIQLEISNIEGGNNRHNHYYRKAQISSQPRSRGTRES